MRLTRLIIFSLFAVSFFPGLTAAQNIVPNPGFETVITTPTGENQLNFAQPWQPLGATPDLFYRNSVPSSGAPCDNVNVPTSTAGYGQERNGLNGYAGIQFDFSNGYREYLSVPLGIPLVPGDIYRIEFYAQRADSTRFACNRLGALLTNNIPIQPGTGVIGFTPQVESTILMSDTAAWYYVTGIYQASGGENYLTIGLFRSDSDPGLAKTDFGASSSGCSNYDNSAYYFIDDVSVKPVSENVEISGDTIICPGETAMLIADSNVPVWWSNETDPTDTISQNDTLFVNTNVPITYYLNGLFITDSVVVDIIAPPSFSLGPDTLMCQDDSILLDATAPDGIAYQWSTGDTTAMIQVRDTGVYWATTYNLGCSLTDTLTVSDYLPNAPFSLGEDSLYCFFTYDTLRLDAGPGTSYLWSPTGETSQLISVMFPAVYSVILTRENGCKRTDSLEVSEVCEPLIYLPNAFTPDGDGVNDVFLPQIHNATDYNLRIVNRRGQTVFYTTDPAKGWDGTFDGQDAAIDVYVYRINYRGLDFEGSKVKRKQLGSITLVR